jgi:hypothetical protein
MIIITVVVVVILKKNKNNELDLKDRIQNYKNLTKRPRKKIRNQKKMNQIEIIIIIEKTKIINLI